MKARTVGAIVVAVLVVAAVTSAQSGSSMPASGQQKAGPWYQATVVAEKVWRIDDHGSDNMYLVEGDKQALLVDTGLGAARLGEFVKTLTKLPVTVVNTHGHVDHAGGNGFFPQAYAHPADFDAIRAINAPEARRNAAERTVKASPTLDVLKPEEAARLVPATLLPLKGGHIFDLGGRRLEVIEQPGHTPGEIVLLDKAHRLLITGDNNNTLVWLFLPASEPLDTYLASLKALKQRAADFDTILPGHGGPLPKSHLDDQIACLEEILNGTCKDEPYQSFAGQARVCKHGPASVAFDPKKLHAAK